MINIPLGALALFITSRFVPESKNNQITEIDYLGAGLIFLSLLGITSGLINGPGTGWMMPELVSLTVGVVLFVLFVFREKRIKDPIVPLHIFKSSLVTGANLVTFFLYFALSGVIFFLVLNFQQIQHYSPLWAGMGLLPAILIITFLSGPGGILADKIGPRLPMILGPLIVCLGMTLLILPGRGANYFVQYLPGLILFGLGMSIVIAPLTKSALAVESEYSGGASGVNNAVARVAGLFAVALLGAIILSLFTSQLSKRLNIAKMQDDQKFQIMQQKNRLSGIEMPKNFNEHTKTLAKTAVEDSFIYGFRWLMGINALLAFLSVVIAYFTIHNSKKQKIHQHDR